MKFTGERFIPSEQGEIRLDHLHRYALVLELIKGRKVLDIACGEGYGSFMMARFASSLVGIDISQETVEHASSVYKKSNLLFEQGDVAKINHLVNTFDVVVSFETIEHLSQQRKMISEIKRVLKHDGFLIISSPNSPVYSEKQTKNNYRTHHLYGEYWHPA